MTRASLWGAVLIVISLLAGGSAPLRAQEIFGADQLTERPQLLSPTKAAQLLGAAYPKQLQQAGTTGTVQLAFVVDANGKVDPASVEVVAATEPAFTDAAKSVAQKLEFKPGKKDGQPVRCRVVFPLTFR